MKSIVTKYHKEGSNYLLPVLDETETVPKKREKAGAFNKGINYMTKQAAKDSKSPNWKNINTYSTRHALATYSRFEENYNTAVVANVLGHKSEKSTEEYKGKLDFSMLKKIDWSSTIRRQSRVNDWAADGKE